MDNKYNFRTLFKKYLSYLNNIDNKMPFYKDIKIFYSIEMTCSNNDIFNKSKSYDDIALEWQNILNRGYSWIDFRTLGIYKKILYIFILHSDENIFPKGIYPKKIQFIGPGKKWEVEPL